MTNMTHEIKLQQGFCDAVYNGDKCFEIRYNDRGYQKGDFVKFIPVDNCGVTFPHPISIKKFEITYVMSDWGIKEGFVVFGIKAVKEFEES